MVPDTIVIISATATVMSNPAKPQIRKPLKQDGIPS
jgi:hypothetical protein